MIKNIPENEKESLGQFLRRNREEQGLSLEEVANVTKISLSILTALEEDDYANLPAEAFVRGFYGIYAGHLSLDPDMVRERYVQQQKNMPSRSTKRIPTPTQLAMETSSMAERPSVNSNSIIGLSIMAIFIITAAVCWYLSWNPATYLSQKLRGVPKEPATSSEQQMPEGQPADQPATETAETLSRPAETAVAPVTDKATTKSAAGEEPAPEKSTITSPIIPIAPLATTPAGQQKTVSPVAPFSTQPTQSNQPDKTAQTPITPGITTYLLKVTAKEPTQLTIKVDDNPAERLSLAAGEQRNWNAGKSIVITLPAGTGAAFTLNDIPLNLPKKAPGQEIKVSIPEYLLE